MQTAAHESADPVSKPADKTALLLLLAYVEAECRRIGAIEAASHAALAASAVEQVQPHVSKQRLSACRH